MDQLERFLRTCYATSKFGGTKIGITYMSLISGRFTHSAKCHSGVWKEFVRSSDSHICVTSGEANIN